MSDFFGLRSPLLPFTAYLNWASHLQAPRATEAGDSLEAAIAADRRRLRAGLRALIECREVREALYVASASLDKSLAHWLEAPESPRGLAAELVLVRYFQRMTHRCTPFGLFAGHSVGTFAERTALTLGPLDTYRRHTRLDRGLTSKLVSHLEKLGVLRETATIYPNTSLYRTAGRLRYFEFTVDDNGSRHYRLVAVVEDPYLLEVLARAQSGATLSQLAQTLIATADVSVEEAKAFVNELIDTQILVMDLEQPLTGPDTIDAWIARLQRFTETRETAHIVREVVDRMSAMDREGLGHDPGAYDSLTAQLARLPITAGPTSAWQVDLFKPASQLELGTDVAAAFQDCAALLHRIAPASTTDSLAPFREAFERRYGERWVPLMEALDPETGIGFPVGMGTGADDPSLLAGFVADAGSPRPEVAWNAREVFLIRKLEQLLAQDAREWALSEADLQALDSKASTDTLPDSCDLLVRLMTASPEALQNGDFGVFVQGCFGPPAGRTLGRFCYGDEALHARTREHLRQEEQFRPDVLFAEIVHLPQGRTGNILARPVLREHEIVFLGRSGAPAERQIKVSDLVIRVIDQRVVLFSIAHGKEVMPRLTTALNYSITHSVSHFLSTLGEQHTRNSLGWNWGRLRQERFLPRVSCGRFVLARATWAVSAEELKPILAATDAARFQKVQAWRTDRGLPRFCLLIDGDNELLTDLDNILSIDTFCELARRRSGISLEECLPGARDLAVTGPAGQFTHELVVPLLRGPTGVRPPATSGSEPNGAAKVTEHFPPGSEWLFFKLQGGEGTADGVLAEAIAPALTQLREGGVIDNWFFIRYADPDTHLRVRLHGDPARLAAEALPRLHEVLGPMLDSRALSRIELATYEREIHRYGGPFNIERAERLFGFDSDAALAIVSACPGDQGANFRWQLALAGVDRWLRDFGLDLAARRRFARSARDGYLSEFKAPHATMQKWFAERFRAERKALEPLIASGCVPTEPALAAGLLALDRRSTSAAPLIAEMHELHERKRLSTTPERIAHSVIHMFVNRVMRSAQRKQELVIYEFLARLYDSEWARSRPEQRPAHG